MLRILRNSSSRVRRPALWLPALVLAGLALGCSEQPASPELSDDGLTLAKGGPPLVCDESPFTPLSITLGDASGDALQSDGQGPYVEAVDDVGAHLNSPTGRLMLSPSPNGTGSRFVEVATTAGTFQTQDRIYTNTHNNDGDPELEACGLDGIPDGLQPGATGDAAFEVELDDPDGVDNGIVRYGKDCNGAIVSANKVVTTRSINGNTWTISGISGVHCRQPAGQKKPGLAPVGTAGPFSMTLVKIGA